MKKRNLWIALITATILGVLIYAPVIHVPTFASAFSAVYIPPHTFDSVTMKFLNFGTQYYGPYTPYYDHGWLEFCLSLPQCGPTPFAFGALLWADLPVAIAAIDVALFVTFILTKKGLTGALSQLGFGVLAVISPVLILFLGTAPLWMNIHRLVVEEIIVVGTVLILTAFAEIWWFRRGKQRQFVSQSQELEMQSSSTSGMKS